MAELGVTASVIAVVQVAASVASLCNQYLQDVRHAGNEISQLRKQVVQLQTTVENVQQLLQGKDGAKLKTSQQLLNAIRDAQSNLEQVHNKLRPKTGKEALGLSRLRSFKWPFESKETKQMVQDLERVSQNISLALQVDQTTVLFDIQEVVKNLGLHMTESASSSPKAYRMIPFPADHDFVHRPAIEEWMRDQYRQQDRRMALVGMGGFGKSQLAMDFAHHIFADEPGTSVFWIHGHSKATFEESYRALADVVALPRRHEPDVNLLGLVRDWLQRDDSSPWLMVVDNADDIKVFSNQTSSEPLSSYLPKSSKGKILVTSRNITVAEKLVGPRRVIRQIDVMGEAEAVELFQNKIPDKADEAAVRELVIALNCIPLAVSQAAAYIDRRSPRVNVASYLDEFHKSSKRKDKLLQSDKGDLGRYDGASNSVVITWRVTFEQIKRERPQAANLLSLMSQFQSQNIPENMLHSYDGDTTRTDTDSRDTDSTDTSNSSDAASIEVDFEDDIDVLRGYSLVTLSTTGFWEMHPLVQFCTRLWILQFGDPLRWNGLFVKLAADHFPLPDPRNWTICQNLLPHIEVLLSRSPTTRNKRLPWTELLARVSYYMIDIGQYSRAVVLAEQAVQLQSIILGPDHLITLRSIQSLATAFRNQGRLEAAEELELRVLEARKAHLAANQPDITTSIGNRASIYGKSGRWEEAEKLDADRLKAQILLSMNNLAITYRIQGRLEKAEKLQVEVLEARRVKLRANHPDMLTSMNNLAVTYWRQGRLEEAEKLQVEVLKAIKVKLGADHLKTLRSIGNLASTYGKQGRLEEAEKLQVEVLEVQRVKLGADHLDTLKSMYNLAMTWNSQDRNEEAVALMQDCVYLLRKTQGHNHPGTKSSEDILRSWQV